MPEPMRPQPSTPTFLISIMTPEEKRAADFTDDHGSKKLTNLRVMVLFLMVRICEDPSLKIQQRLHDHGDSLPAADASGRQPIFLLPPPQFVQQRDQQPCPGRAQ